MHQLLITRCALSFVRKCAVYRTTKKIIIDTVPAKHKQYKVGKSLTFRLSQTFYRYRVNLLYRTAFIYFFHLTTFIHLLFRALNKEQVSLYSNR